MKFTKKIISKQVAVLSVIALVVAFLFPILAKAQNPASFLGGNIMTGTNNTSGDGTWIDPVSASPGEVIEFRVVAQNQTPGVTINNVKVSANLPAERSVSPTASATVTGDNASAVTDTVVVNVVGGSQQGFAYIPGHGRLFSPGCPSGCDVGDEVVSGGLNVGSLGPGESTQVLFKAYVTNIVSATPTPTISPTATPTVVPTVPPTVVPTQPPSPTPQPQGNITELINELINDIRNENRNSQDQTQNNNQTVNVTQSTAAVSAPVVAQAAVKPIVAPVKELPKTGLPLAVWALASLLPAGLGMKRINKKTEQNNSSSNVNHVWRKRVFNQE
ncbi:hypothetical protein C4544_04535 [candidate division WS5 bacterium]|uniref:DUF11 domain-containing protein n=1 Tax=candidate division WS5 bacterium TaxID=2093353 RepID=A0A419DCE6_9BACT|nr:MAG: hypothetical protein C4544_04535 [candidate division WS5 bacterium]